ncbi:MAG: hypothetical protein N2654_03115 [Deltaproteobacteria bacterium]|nr:hypothetical protein [Deltaproteobacteria bacterium]
MGLIFHKKSQAERPSKIEPHKFWIVWDQRLTSLEAVFNELGLGVNLGRAFKQLTGASAGYSYYEDTTSARYWLGLILPRLDETALGYEKLIEGIEEKVADLLSRRAINHTFFESLSESEKAGILTLSLFFDFLTKSKTNGAVKFEDLNFKNPLFEALTSIVFYEKMSSGPDRQASQKDDHLKGLSNRKSLRMLQSIAPWYIASFSVSDSIVEGLNIFGVLARLRQLSANLGEKNGRGRVQSFDYFMSFIRMAYGISGTSVSRYFEQFERALYSDKTFITLCDNGCVSNLNWRLVALTALCMVFKSKSEEALARIPPEKLARTVLSKSKNRILKAFALANYDYEALFPHIQSQSGETELILDRTMITYFRDNDTRLLLAALVGFSDPFLNNTIEPQPTNLRERIQAVKKSLSSLRDKIFDTGPKYE